MKHLIEKRKHEFYDIFDKQKADQKEFLFKKGKGSYDSVIDSHLKSWVDFRVNGVSSSMAFYAEIPEAISLIDEIAKEHFGTTRKVSGNANDLEKEIFRLINAHMNNGLRKPDLVKKMKWITGNCEMS